MQCTVDSSSSSKTENIGMKIGKRLKGGEVIELVSDLGGGKTTFVRGLAKGFGSSDRVASPTFTVSKVYKAGKRELHHFDFYRLTDAGIVAHELHELIGLPNASIVVEWADVVHDILPEERLTIKFNPTIDDNRRLNMTCPPKLDYLLENVC